MDLKLRFFEISSQVSSSNYLSKVTIDKVTIGVVDLCDHQFRTMEAFDSVIYIS